MKKYLFFLMAIIVSGAVFSQNSNIIVFHPDGEKFILSINGLEKNESPQSNVKVTKLEADYYELKIAFNNKSLGTLTKPVWFEEKGKEYTYKIHQKNNGKMTLRPISVVDIAEANIETDYEIDDSKYEKPGEYSESETSVVHSETFKIDDAEPDRAGESVSVSMKVNESGVDVKTSDEQQRINMDVKFDMDGQATHTTTTTTRINTTTTDAEYEDAEYIDEFESHSTSSSLGGGCDMPIDKIELDDILSSIESNSFEESKFSTAKQIIKANCLDSKQVKAIADKFSFEKTKLDFAKYAYDYVYDPAKYYKVNDAFTFDASKRELQEYIESKE